MGEKYALGSSPAHWRDFWSLALRRLYILSYMKGSWKPYTDVFQKGWKDAAHKGSDLHFCLLLLITQGQMSSDRSINVPIWWGGGKSCGRFFSCYEHWPLAYKPAFCLLHDQLDTITSESPTGEAEPFVLPQECISRSQLPPKVTAPIWTFLLEISFLINHARPQCGHTASHCISY